MKVFHLCLALLLLAIPCQAQSFWQGKVTKILDGDTIIVQKGKKRIKIRIYGLDCPEYKQAFGKKAKNFTKRLLNKTVKIKAKEKDRYNRLIAQVQGPDGDHGLALIKAGLAWWYQFFAPTKWDYAEAMLKAAKAKKGLWKQNNPLPPWKWKKIYSKK